MTSNPSRHEPEMPTNEPLLNAIVALASNATPTTFEQYYQALLNSQLYLAEDPDASPRPIMLVDEDDGIILPVFTDYKRLKTVFADAVRYSATPAPELCRIALGNGIFKMNINPEQGPGSYLGRDEMEALARNEIPDTSQMGQSSWDNPNFVPMGDPKLPTEAELDEITRQASILLGKESGVVAAYLILMGSGEGASALTIALEFDSGTGQQHKTDFTRQFVPSLEAKVNRLMQATWLDGEHLQEVKSRVKPFYQKS